MFRPLRVVFNLDGSGLYYSPHEPIMLDGLLAAACCRHHVHGEPPARDEEPFDVPLPLKRWQVGDIWVWHASALFPDGDTAETLTYWRRRFRHSRVELTAGAPNLKTGAYRDWQMPLPLLLARRMVAYAYGDAGRVRQELRRNIRWLGKRRAHGHGQVLSIDVEPIDSDCSIVRDGLLMRHMPCPHGSRLIRPRPPYWSSVGRMTCAEAGQPLAA